MKKVIISLLLISLMIMTTGCGLKTHTTEDLLNCNEGKYGLSSEVKDKAVLMDVDIDYFVIIDNLDNTCSLNMKLKKSTMIMGTEVSTIPMVTCRSNLVEQFRNKNMTDYDIYLRLCN